jgi:hypothetical protein
VVVFCSVDLTFLFSFQENELPNPPLVAYTQTKKDRAGGWGFECEMRRDEEKQKHIFVHIKFGI